ETPRKPRPPAKAQCPPTTAIRRSTTPAMCAGATRRRPRTPARSRRTEQPPRRRCLPQARSLAGRLRTVHDARTPWTQLCAPEGIWQGRDMTTRAGQLAQDQDLVDIPALLDSYHDLVPDPSVPTQAVSFGTSGHRGSSFNRSFNEAHIAAIPAAIVDFRRDKGIRGPIFLGRDTHALSEPAFLTVLEVLAAAEVHALIDERDG